MSLFDKILEKLGLNRPAKAEPVPQVPPFSGRGFEG